MLTINDHANKLATILILSNISITLKRTRETNLNLAVSLAAD